MNPRLVYQYWLLTAVALGAGLTVWPPGILIAMVVTAAHTVHFFVYRPQAGAFPIQVRVGFLGLLALGQLPYLGWLNWVLCVGVASLLIFGYCPLARLLSLAPWNRSRPMSWNLVRTALFSPPVAGSIIDVVSPPATIAPHT